MSNASPLVASPAATAPRPATPAANGVPSQPPPADTVPVANGHAAHTHENRPAPAPPSAAAMTGKKGKQKKPEPTEASKLIAQRISQLELDAAGEKDQEAEIGGCSPCFLCVWWGVSLVATLSGKKGIFWGSSLHKPHTQDYGTTKHKPVMTGIWADRDRTQNGKSRRPTGSYTPRPLG